MNFIIGIDLVFQDSSYWKCLWKKVKLSVEVKDEIKTLKYIIALF